MSVTRLIDSKHLQNLNAFPIQLFECIKSIKNCILYSCSLHNSIYLSIFLWSRLLTTVTYLWEWEQAWDWLKNTIKIFVYVFFETSIVWIHKTKLYMSLSIKNCLLYRCFQLWSRLNRSITIYIWASFNDLAYTLLPWACGSDRGLEIDSLNSWKRALKELSKITLKFRWFASRSKLTHFSIISPSTSQRPSLLTADSYSTGAIPLSVMPFRDAVSVVEPSA